MAKHWYEEQIERDRKTITVLCYEIGALRSMMQRVLDGIDKDYRLAENKRTLQEGIDKEKMKKWAEDLYDEMQGHVKTSV